MNRYGLIPEKIECMKKLCQEKKEFLKSFSKFGNSFEKAIFAIN